MCGMNAGHQGCLRRQLIRGRSFLWERFDRKGVSQGAPDYGLAGRSKVVAVNRAPSGSAGHQ